MIKKGKFPYALLFFSLLIFYSSLSAEQIRIATASNFSLTLKAIAQQFEQKTGHKVTIISGSTGKLYAQIINGAPFDAFFSADSKRAERLDLEGFAISGSRFTYAIGKIILWSPKPGFVDSHGDILHQDGFRYLAIANPKLAPYGRAAQQVLKQHKLWQNLSSRMVRGENIGQTFHFVKSGLAELGFIALSQVQQPGQAIEGSYWSIPQALYSPIAQQAVLLKDNHTSRLFLAFIKNQSSLKIINNFGYAIPANTIKGGDNAQ